jgi:hypothetical protein
LARDTQIRNGQENCCTERGWKASSERDVDADKHHRAAHTRSQQSLHQADNEAFDTYKVDRSGPSPHRSFEEGYLNSSMAAISTTLPRPLLEWRPTTTTSVDVQCIARNQLEGHKFRTRNLQANTERKGNVRELLQGVWDHDAACQRIAQQPTSIISKDVLLSLHEPSNSNLSLDAGKVVEVVSLIGSSPHESLQDQR